MVERARKRTVKAAVAKVEPIHEVQLGFLSEFVGFHLRLAQDASYRAFSRQRDKDLIKPGRFPALGDHPSQSRHLAKRPRSCDRPRQVDREPADQGPSEKRVHQPQGRRLWIGAA